MTVETSDIRVGGISESLRRALFTRDGRQRTGRTVFFTALVLYGVAYCFSTSSLVFDYGNVYKITRTLMDVALAIAALKIVFFTPYRQTEKLLMFLPVVAAAAALVTSGFYQLLDLMVFVVAARGIKFEDICKCVFVTWGVCILVIIALAALGISSWGAHGIENNSGLVRHSCGFRRWTDCGAVMLVPYMVYYKLRFEKFNIADYLAGIAFVLFLLFFVASRASAALVVLLLLFTLLGKIVSKRLRIMMVVLAVVMVAMLVLAFLLPFLYEHFAYGHGTIFNLNTVLSDRIHYSYGVIASSPLTLFGQQVDYTNTVVGWTFLDSSYVWLMVNEGVVSYACVVFLYALLFWHAYKNRNVALMILVAVVVVAGFAELTTILLGRNVVLLALLSEIGKTRSRGHQGMAG